MNNSNLTPSKKVKTFVLHLAMLWHRQKAPSVYEFSDLSLKSTQDPRSLSRSEEAKMQEALALAEAIDLEIVGYEILNINSPRPSTLLGKGQVDLAHGMMSGAQAELVFINAKLSPVQQRNLEKTWKIKVIDRTGLILEIFGARAKTAEGRLQVELAALSYQRSRLVRAWTHLERQRGGFGFTGGPGETQIELDRRLIDERIVKIKKDLEHIKQTRTLHRSARSKVPYPTVAIVGYTNAGKSTLFNKLTHSDVFAHDLLFATLDPTMRQIKLGSGAQVILSDTVGFISDLPTTLIAAFRATLEEVMAADIILHVQDSSHPNRDLQAKDVEKVLQDLGVSLDTKPLVNAFNKVDMLSLEEKEYLKNQVQRTSNSVMISALTGEGFDELLKMIDHTLHKEKHVKTVFLSPESGELLAWCYRQGGVLKREDVENGLLLTLSFDTNTWQKFWERYKRKQDIK